MSIRTPAAPAPAGGNTARATLCVHLNGQPLQVPVGTDLAALLAQSAADLDPRHCATAVNGGFVPRAARPATPLRDGDAITTFQAIVGG
ncbi:MAG TPA: sulfur carrier protein ThiS [Burkholderiaceae bacterium]|nr:sulfur carrier protein ThiS [Burkholderiaceae bacterium]